jgi:hypothetical protein
MAFQIEVVLDLVGYALEGSVQRGGDAPLPWLNGVLSRHRSPLAR